MCVHAPNYHVLKYSIIDKYKFHSTVFFLHFLSTPFRYDSKWSFHVEDGGDSMVEEFCQLV